MERLTASTDTFLNPKNLFCKTLSGKSTIKCFIVHNKTPKSNYESVSFETDQTSTFERFIRQNFIKQYCSLTFLLFLQCNFFLNSINSQKKNKTSLTR